MFYPVMFSKNEFMKSKSERSMNVHQNIREKQSNKSSFLGVLSILFPIVLGLLILNFFTDIIPLEKIQGLPVLMPLFVCPIGAVIGFLGYKRSRDTLSLVGIIANVVLFLFPVFYHILGTLIMGN
jgi:ABC-type polysaccharide/polyol phosphate export permease